MKKPTAASQKRVTPENLARLGAERLAQLLAAAADARPELKRRLRMELAAEQGSEHLAIEIDKRLASLETSRSKVSWRQRKTFLRDLDGLRALITGRLAALDRPGALARVWLFMGLARRVQGRVRDRDGELAAIFERAAIELGPLVSENEIDPAANALARAISENAAAWADWLPSTLGAAPPALASATLRRLSEAPDTTPGRMGVLRQLARAAGDPDALKATYTASALRTPAAAADVAQMLLEGGRSAEAGQLLEAARPPPPGRRSPAADPTDSGAWAWESAWIDYLEGAGQAQAAQAARWTSFERTLSAERARAFTTRLEGFDDVVAEERAFAHAAQHADAARALRFLMDWPAHAEAARLIEARADDLQASPEEAEVWAGRLQARYPAAAHLLLRRTAAAAFRRRDFATCDRLTEQADAIAL